MRRGGQAHEAVAALTAELAEQKQAATSAQRRAEMLKSRERQLAPKVDELQAALDQLVRFDWSHGSSPLGATAEWRLRALVYDLF